MRLTLVILSLLVASVVHAETYQLFRKVQNDLINSVPSNDYNDILEKLKPGDRVIFSGGESFTIHELLGAGNTTRVFSIGKGRVLRLPKYSHLTGFHEKFLNGYQDLAREGVRTPRVFVTESKRGEYIVVEQANKLFDLHEYLHAEVQLDREQLKKIRAEFIEFAKSTAAFVRIADLHAKNIVYTKELGWVVMDWSHPHMPTRLFPNLAGHTAFDRILRALPGAGFGFKPPFILRYQVRTAIQSARAAPKSIYRCAELF